MYRLFLAAAAVIATPLAATQAQTPMSGATFARMAGASDQYELQSSRLVLRTTRNGQVRRFADMMIADHTKSTADVKRAARAGGVRLTPPRLDAVGQRNVAALRAARGTDRDALYLRQQRASHEKALSLHRSYAARGSVAPLRAVARQTAPVVRSHLAMLRRM